MTKISKLALSALCILRKLCGYRLPRIGRTAYESFRRHSPNILESELFPGIHATLNLEDDTQAATFWQGTRFEYPTGKILLSWADDTPTTFFDIGSNYGFFSYLLLSKLRAISVHAFEPNPETFAKMRTIKERNRLNKMSIWNLGLGSQKEKLILHAGINDSGHSTFGNHPELLESNNFIVDIISFDDWLDEQKITMPDRPTWIAKIDVEGFEFKVLQGMKKSLAAKLFRGLCIEINDFTLDLMGTKRSEIFTYLEKLGYEPLRNQAGLNSVNLSSTANSFFVPTK